jgi:hypothetical protein
VEVEAVIAIGGVFSVTKAGHFSRKMATQEEHMKFISGIVLGMVLTAGMALFAQNERAMHPRIAAAVAALRDARAYMAEAPHDFGGHKEAAIKACDDAIRQLNFALAYRGKMDK